MGPLPGRRDDRALASEQPAAILGDGDGREVNEPLHRPIAQPFVLPVEHRNRVVDCDDPRMIQVIQDQPPTLRLVAIGWTPWAPLAERSPGPRSSADRPAPAPRRPARRPGSAVLDGEEQVVAEASLHPVDEPGQARRQPGRILAGDLRLERDGLPAGFRGCRWKRWSATAATRCPSWFISQRFHPVSRAALLGSSLVRIGH